MPELLEQRPRCRLLDPALDLIAHAVRIDHQAWIDDAPDAQHAYGAGGGDLDLGDLRDVGAVIERAGEAVPVPRGELLPIRAHFCDPLDNAAQARVVDVTQPERERVLLRSVSQLVDERLDREDVLRRRERAEVRGAQRRRLDVEDDTRARDRVRGHGVPARRHRRDARIRTRGGVDVGVLVVAPRDHAPARVESGRDLEDRLGPAGGVRELFGPRPLHEHRTARVLGKDRGLDRHVGRAAATVRAARHLRHHAHAFLGESHGTGDGIA